MYDRPTSVFRLTLILVAVAMIFAAGILTATTGHWQDGGEQKESATTPYEIDKNLEISVLSELSGLQIPHYPDYEDGFSEVEDLKDAILSLKLSEGDDTSYVKLTSFKQKFINKPIVKPVIKPGKPGKVAIVIDDMGVSHSLSKAVMSLKAPLTLSFLPYAEGCAQMAAEAKAGGHEIMVHVPMEPINSHLDTGSGVLLSSMSGEEIVKVLDEDLSVFSGYVGINNHMGSRLTQDAEAMAAVMGELKKRGLFFSIFKTISTSVAADVARDAGIAYASRDVFLDHDPGYGSVIKSLEKLEDLARKRGYAIAIGHPKPATVKALSDWIGKLKDKSITIVPLSELVTKSESGVDSVAAEKDETLLLLRE